jgi:hypothetical protein
LVASIAGFCPRVPTLNGAYALGHGCDRARGARGSREHDDRVLALKDCKDDVTLDTRDGGPAGPEADARTG